MKRAAALIAAAGVLAWSGSLAAHHSLARFDTTTPVWVKGTVVRVELVNPHTRIVVDQPGEHGRGQQWTIDGPAPNVLSRMGLSDGFPKPGEVIEVCGFVLKADAETTAPSRLMNGHLLVMPNGKRRFWSDYGQFEKCISPDENKETYRREAFGR